MKRLFMLIVIAVNLLMGGVAMAGPTSSAQSEVCAGVNANVAASDCGGAAGGTTITKVLSAILQIISWIAGIAAIIMIVLAGMKYITSGGDSGSIASAKTTLIYALVGVVIVAMAQVLVHFVIKIAKA